MQAQEAAEKAEAEATAAKLEGERPREGSGQGRQRRAAVRRGDQQGDRRRLRPARHRHPQDQDRPGQPIKAFGYELKVKLGYEVTGTLKVVVAEAWSGTRQEAVLYTLAGLPWVGAAFMAARGRSQGSPLRRCVLSARIYAPEVRNMPSEEEL